jgi:hypothetical protein
MAPQLTCDEARTPVSSKCFKRVLNIRTRSTTKRRASGSHRVRRKKIVYDDYDFAKLRKTQNQKMKVSPIKQEDCTR